MLPPMRALFVTILVVLAGCPVSAELNAQGDDSGSGSGAGAVPECRAATDCAAAGAKCCDCPTYAVPITDAASRACMDVDCGPPNDCGSPMQAACESGKCVLECAPVACTGASCGDGFQIDGNGCLTCSCNVATSTQCGADTDCARVRDDCCGCALGGEDTAIPVSLTAAHEAQLMCPTNPSCSEVYTCEPDLAARCVQGQCTLVSGVLPPNACGRADLPACPDGEDCTVNADDQASAQGVGVCLPRP